MHRFVSIWLTVPVLSLISCGAQIPCIQDEDFPKQHRSIEFDLSSKMNQTGHWISNLSIHRDVPKLPYNMKVKLQQHNTECPGVPSLYLNVMVTVPPHRPIDYELFQGIGYYKFHTEAAANFDDAIIQCSKEGGHLAIINSERESQVLQMIFARYPNAGKVKSDWAYIGFHDRYNEGEFLTIFGNPLNSTGFKRWSSAGQPDDAGNSEDCGSIHRNGGLNDINCKTGIPFFCEYDLAWESI